MPYLGPEGRRQLKTFARFGAVGIELGLTVGMGLLAGRWLDTKLDTSPALMLLGLVLGAVVGFRRLLITARALSKTEDHRTDPDE